MKVIRILLAVMMLGAVLTLAGCPDSSAPDSVPGQVPENGGIAPDFTLKSLDGETISLSDLRGKPVVLNFWATWCGPCRTEMPYLQEVSDDPEWTERGVVILAVNIGESASTAQEFMDRNGLSFTVLLDTNRQVGAQYNTRYIPTTYFIGKDGIIRNIKVGAFSKKSDIDRLIIDMLSNGEL